MRRYAPDPAGGANSAPPELLTGFGGEEKKGKGREKEKELKGKKGKGGPYSITERRVPELIPVLGSQPAGDVSHKPVR